MLADYFPRSTLTRDVSGGASARTPVLEGA